MREFVGYSNNELSKDTLEEIRKLALAATPGEWRLDSIHVFQDGTDESQIQARKDVLFMAHAREDVLLLLNEIDRLKTELKNAI